MDRKHRRIYSFMNGVFGLSLDHDGSSTTCVRGAISTRTSASTDTPFAQGPSSLFWKGQTYCLDSTSLPLNSTVLYGDSSVSWAARMLGGAVVYLGYDWRTTASNNNWNLVLDAAIDSSDLSACAPTWSPTVSPSVVPSFSPTVSPSTSIPTTAAPSVVATTSAPTVTLSAMPSAIPTTAPPTLAPSPVACTGSVLLLTDEAFIGAPEASNLLAALVTLNHPVTEVSSFATGDIANGLLSGHSTLIIPEQRTGSFFARLSVDDIAGLQLFAVGGGTVIVHGSETSQDISFMNGVFGLSLDHDGSSTTCVRGAISTRTSASTDTPFAQGPSSLFWKGQTYCLDSTSLPLNSTVLYGDSSVSWAARMLGGAVVYLGYDWRTTASNNNWNLVLDAAIDSSDLSACAPTWSPTVSPSVVPSFSPDS